VSANEERVVFLFLLLPPVVVAAAGLLVRLWLIVRTLLLLHADVGCLHVVDPLFLARPFDAVSAGDVDGRACAGKAGAFVVVVVAAAAAAEGGKPMPDDGRC
jgi:hypothetical protein